MYATVLLSIFDGYMPLIQKNNIDYTCFQNYFYRKNSNSKMNLLSGFVCKSLEDIGLDIGLVL